MRTALVCLLSLTIACDGGQPKARAPDLQFALPRVGAILWKPEVVSVAGEGIKRVEFVLNGQLQFEDETSPFEWTLDPAVRAPGPYDLTVLAKTGANMESGRVRLTLVPSPKHPTLATVSPRTGASAGGTLMRLTGTNLSADATVTINGVAANKVKVLNDSVIICSTPAGVAPDRVDLTVSTSGGAFTYPRSFRYLPAASESGRFPLSIHASGRYLVQADGTPFFIHGDTPWSIAVQLTERQIDLYLEDRQRKGFNTILFNGIEAYFSSQRPAYKNANGDAPFGAMSPIDFTASDESYWSHVDYIVDEAKARGIACIMVPAYLGYRGGEQGFHSTIKDTGDSDLEAYGEFLARRFTQGNIIWCMGGDYVPPDVTKQWKVVTGIRNVRTTDILTGHTGPGDEAWTDWKDQAGFNLNNIYGREISPTIWWYQRAATAYARSGPIPFFLIEARYEGEGIDPARIRLQAYTSILSGACGHMFACNPVWGFGEPHFSRGQGAAAALANHLDSTATLQMVQLRMLFESCEWWKLKPSTGSELVTSYLGYGQDRICPTLAGDRTFAMIWNPNSGRVTIDMGALRPSRVRARFFDTTDGTYATVSGSPFGNSGTQDITWPGERVLVLDADG